MFPTLLLLLGLTGTSPIDLASARVLPGPVLTRAQVDAFVAANSAGDAALEAGKPHRAVAAYLRATAIFDGNESCWYNLACAHAMAGSTSEAVVALERAVTTRPSLRKSTVEFAATDPDLASLRTDEGFRNWLTSSESGPATDPHPPLSVPAMTASEIRRLHDEAMVVLGWMGDALTGAGRSDWYGHVLAWRRMAWKARVDAAAAGPPTRSGRLEAIRALSGDCAMRIDPDSARFIVRLSSEWLEHSELDRTSLDVAEVKLRLAESRCVVDASASAEAATHAVDALRHELFVLASTRGCSPVLEHALVHLLGLEQSHRDHAADVIARLSDCVDGSEEELLQRVSQDVRAVGTYQAVVGLPSFDIVTTDRRHVSTKGERKGPTLLQFWASWCGPCRAEFPHLAELWTRHGVSGLDLIGVNIDPRDLQRPGELEAWCKKNGVTWPQATNGPALAKLLGIEAVPNLILIGRDGAVVGAGRELLEGDGLERALTAALATAPGTEVD